MPAYYNEFEPYAAQWLRNLIAAGHIAPGDVDERSIVDVRPDDLAGYTQCHFFAGIGGWSFAARLAGWPDDRELWTGSCPCQPFSVAGRGEGQADERHLWPEQFRLISARRPTVWMGEQVAAAVGKHWLDGVYADLESVGYACGAVVVPACAVDAPHRRDRAWVVANCGSERWERGQGAEERHEPYRAHAEWIKGDGRASGICEDDRGRGVDVGNPEGIGREGGDLYAGPRMPESGVAKTDRRNSTAWSGAGWIAGADGKSRRIEPGVRLLAHGVPARVGRLRAYGNAIVPQVAAEVIAAFMEVAP